MVPHMPSFARHPVIADQNVLVQDIFRYRSKRFSALTFLAQHEAITLLTAAHARSRIPEIIAEKSAAPAHDLQVWKSVYLPRVRFVEVPESMCAGEPRIESIQDLEDVPFARLAIATAPSLLLTRDHHLLKAGLGTKEWAEALKILGTLVEMDALMYGGAHGAVLAARLLGLLAARLWRAAAEAPILTAAVAVLGLLYALANPTETIQAARRTIETVRTQGTRLLELSEPAFERKQDAEGELAGRLEAPILPRDLESACARALAVRPSPIGNKDLIDVLGEGSPAAVALARYLHGHPSFTSTSEEGWELGELGVPVIDAAAGGPRQGWPTAARLARSSTLPQRHVTARRC